jgi:hypothetical protein
VATVEEFCPSLGLQPVKPAAKRYKILGHLHDCHIFHFASHRESNPFERSQSCLDLGGGPVLTVADLRDCRLQDRTPFLAYLFACSTKMNEAWLCWIHPLLPAPPESALSSLPEPAALPQEGG